MRFGAVPVRLPCAGEPAVKVSCWPSTSVPARVIGRAVSSSVVTVCAAASGVSLTGDTVMVTVAGSEVRIPSPTVKVKL